jgi:phosphomannomutase
VIKNNLTLNLSNSKNITINFGTDGYRGIIADSFTFERAGIISAALGRYLIKNRDFQIVNGIVKSVGESQGNNHPINRSPHAPNHYGDKYDNLPLVVAIGYDTRFLSKEFALICAKTLLFMGIKVILSDSFCPSPVLSYTVREKSCACGVMITASHNPFMYNGIKFKSGFGSSMLEEDVKEIEYIANNFSEAEIKDIKSANVYQIGNCQTGESDAEPIMAGNNEAKDKNRNINKKKDKYIEHNHNNDINEDEKLSYLNFKDNYIDHILSFTGINKIKDGSIFKNIEVAIDPMYGAGIGYLGAALDKLSIKYHVINGVINPVFPGINPEPIEDNIHKLVRLAKKLGKLNKFAVGFATDGDADRIGAVDAYGNFIDSHKIFSLILNFLLEEGFSGDVVRTVSVSKSIDYICAKFKVKLHEVPIGFKNIAELMTKSGGNILMGGEESGGIGITSHLPERDGIFNALMILKIIIMREKPINQLINDIYNKPYPFVYKRKDIYLPEYNKSKVITALRDGSFDVPFRTDIAATNFIDGFKFEYKDNSWLLIRPSGTEPLLRIYSESESNERTQLLINNTINLIKKF